MERRCKEGMYPPRVDMTVMLKSSDASFKLPIQFTGHDRGDDLDMELALPLGKLWETFPTPLQQLVLTLGQSCTKV